MEKSEPTLVPQWLKGSNGSVTGGGSSVHQSASALHTDDHFGLVPNTKKFPFGSGDYDNPRTSSSRTNFRRSSSSNGSIMHEIRYGGSSWCHRSRDWDKDMEFREKEKIFVGDHSDFNVLSDSFMLTNDILTRKDALRRSQSITAGRKGDTWPSRVGDGQNKVASVGLGTTGNHTNMHKSSFERNFPSLGTEVKVVVAEAGRGSSLGLSTASQSLPVSSTSIIGGNGWTSALAEVPVLVGAGNCVHTSLLNTSPASPAIVSLSSTAGLNMAEALAQGPIRTQTPPELSVETQRLEELAIKQSRQLIPVTPSMPKSLALGPSEKPKSKASRTTELNSISKVVQLASASQHNGQPLRGLSKSDPSRTSKPNSKLLVLNREKNDSSGAGARETPGLIHGNNLPVGVSPLTTSTALLRSSIAKTKVSAPSSQCSSTMNKKPQSQVQNRNDFFNSLRKKTCANNKNVDTVSDSALSPFFSENTEEQVLEDSSCFVAEGNCAVLSGFVLDLGSSESNGVSHVGGDGGICKESERSCSGEEESSNLDIYIYPEEEEEAFLKSLGWEANAGEEALTEEEIKAFVAEYKKLRPSSKLFQGSEQSKTARVDLRAGSLCGDSSASLFTSGSETKA